MSEAREAALAALAERSGLRGIVGRQLMESALDALASSPEVRAALVEHVVPMCGRCSGKGTERHQLDRDPAAGYGLHACPACSGRGLNRDALHAVNAILAALAGTQAPEASEEGDGGG